MVSYNVSWLEAVGDKVSLKFRLMTELCKYKTNFKLSPKPPIASNRCYQMPFWAVSFSIPIFHSCVFIICYYAFVNSIFELTYCTCVLIKCICVLVYRLFVLIKVNYGFNNRIFVLIKSICAFIKVNLSFVIVIYGLIKVN